MCHLGTGSTDASSGCLNSAPFLLLSLWSCVCKHSRGNMRGVGLKAQVCAIARGFSLCPSAFCQLSLCACVRLCFLEKLGGAGELVGPRVLAQGRACLGFPGPPRWADLLNGGMWQVLGPGTVQGLGTAQGLGAVHEPGTLQGLGTVQGLETVQGLGAVLELGIVPGLGIVHGLGAAQGLGL